jgi:hypothetical protein
VVDPRFCFPQQTILIMQEQLGMFRNDSFSITDSTGRPFFVLAAAPSLSGNRTLLDIYQAPVLQMQRKMPSLRGTWLMNRAADGVRVASVRPAMGFSPSKVTPNLQALPLAVRVLAMVVLAQNMLALRRPRRGCVTQCLRVHCLLRMLLGSCSTTPLPFIILVLTAGFVVLQPSRSS